jgi:O-antigen/teichoic acid export membrane protein
VLAKNNEAFKASYYIGIIIILSYASKPLYSACINWLTFNNKTKYLWRITFVGGIINLLINIFLVPKYGIMASAIATFICMLFVSFVGFYTRAYQKIKSQNYKPFLWIILYFSALIFAYYLKDISFYTKILISVSTLSLSILFIYKQKINLFHNQSV